jgi:hypothetical protein
MSLISIAASIDIGEVSGTSNVERSGGRVMVHRSVPNASDVPREATAAAGDLDDTKPQVFEPHSLEWLQNVYDPHLWGLSPPGGLGTLCDADMKTYLAALNNGTVWAAKSTYIHAFI